MAAFIGFRPQYESLDSTRTAPDSATGSDANQASKPEQIRQFHEKLPAVVDVALRRIQSRHPRRIRHKVWIQILEVAVVADINRSPRMHQISEQEVGVELLLRGQVGVWIKAGARTRQVKLLARRVRQNCVVLENHSQRKLRGELPVPLAAHNV